MQEYQLFMRPLTVGQTVIVDGGLRAQNAEEVLSYLRETYLSKGWKVLSVDYIDSFEIVPNDPAHGIARNFVWHLVREGKELRA